MRNTAMKNTIIEGISFYPNFLSERGEEKLTEQIDALTWDETLSRRTQQFGWKYDYRTKKVTQTDSIPYFAESMKTMICASIGTFDTLGLWEEENDKFAFDQLIINEYIRGQSIAAHVDADVFEDCIAIVSLGSDTFLTMENENGYKEKYLLPRRSLLLLEGDARWNWKHSIKHKGNRRISLTFRKVKDTAKIQSTLQLP